MSEPYRVTFVCTGNICRSPMAEWVFRHHVEEAGLEVEVDSSGTGEWHVGSDADHRWIIDPIDGTKSFIAGVPLYSTLIGLEHSGRSVAGVIYLPPLDEGVHAARGGGAWHFGKDRPQSPARVSTRKQLADSVFVTSQVDSYLDRRAGNVAPDLLRVPVEEWRQHD